MAKRSLLDTFQDPSTRALVHRIMRDHMAPYRWVLAGSLICMMLTAAATALLAAHMEAVIDQMFDSTDRCMVWIVGAQVLGIFILKGCAAYAGLVSMTRAGEGAVRDMRRIMVARVLAADLYFFDKMPTGDLLTRFSSDVAALRHIVGNTLTGLVRDFFTLIFLVCVMVQKDAWLSLVILGSFPLAYYPVVLLGRKTRRSSASLQEHLARFVTQMTQVIQEIRIVKAYGAQARELDHADRLLDETLHHVMKMTRNRAASTPIMEIFTGLAVVGVITYGGLSVMEGTQTKGAFFAFITALILSYEPLRRLANLNAELQERLASAVRVFEIMDIRPQICDGPQASPLPPVKGEIHFQDVSFSYVSDHPILKALNLHIPAGKTAALVGPSGGGKSTILNLIPRFYEPDSGQISIDGHPIASVTLDTLRAQVGLVSQEVSLFDETIAYNIAYGAPDASHEQIVAAAQAAGAHDFIIALPQGYETTIGEQGAFLSGGQRQRLTIARAMLKDAPILLLDEATSALDNTSEQQVQQAIAALSRGRTTLIIAHRLSTVQDADIIFVIAHGAVVAQGTHAQLLEGCDLYASLCQTEFRTRAP